jgi:hypothetical protein
VFDSLQQPVCGWLQVGICPDENIGKMVKTIAFKAFGHSLV